MGIFLLFSLCILTVPGLISLPPDHIIVFVLCLGASFIDTSKYAPTVEGQTQLQKDAATAAAQLGTLVGPDAYKDFMSPYQQDVIDASLAEFDRQQAIQQTGLRDQAIRAGAYGGGREGVMAAEAARGAADQRLQLQAQLLSQGFQQAQAAAAQAAAAQQVRQNIQTYGNRDRPNTGMNRPGGGRGQSPTGGDVAGTPFYRGGIVSML